MARYIFVIPLCFAHFVVYLNNNFVYGNFCETDNDCVSPYRQFCCRNRPNLKRRRCRGNCIGQYCTSDSDCRRHNECCSGVSNQCTTYGCPSECSANSDCESGTYCCQKGKITEKSVCLASCVGEFCRSDTDCGGPQECCSLLNHCTTHGCRHECMANRDCSNNTVCCIKGHRFDKNSCEDSCLGKSCHSDQDCGEIGLCCGTDYFCTEKCNRGKSYKRLGPWLIATIFVGVCFAILLVGILVVFVCCTRRQGQKSGGQTPVVIHVEKDPTLPTSQKPQNTYRRPPPLPSKRTKIFQPPPDWTSTLKSPPEFLEKSHQSTLHTCRTLTKERRKPPSPPGAKSDRIQRDHSPGKSQRPPPRPPRAPHAPHPPHLPPRSDKRVTFGPLSTVRRLPPLPPV